MTGGQFAAMLVDEIATGTPAFFIPSQHLWQEVGGNPRGGCTDTARPAGKNMYGFANDSREG